MMNRSALLVLLAYIPYGMGCAALFYQATVAAIVCFSVFGLMVLIAARWATIDRINQMSVRSKEFIERCKRERGQ